jgi:Nickel responsive protein SCO4226-like
VATFMVEIYLSRDIAGEPDATISRLVSAADRVAAQGPFVRYLRSFYIPEDETCLLVMEAASETTVRSVVDRAGIVADRIAPTDTREGREPPDG